MERASQVNKSITQNPLRGEGELTVSGFTRAIGSESSPIPLKGFPFLLEITSSAGIGNLSFSGALGG